MGASAARCGGWGAPLSPPGGGSERKAAPRARAEKGGGSAAHVHRPGDSRKLEEVFKDFLCIPVRSEINRCREEVKRAAELLNEEKAKLESKVA